MNLSTPVTLENFPVTLDPGASICSIGSCFALTISQFLKDNKFDVLENPFGTLYHPLAIEHIIHKSIESSYSQSDLYLKNSQYHSLAHSTHFSDSNSDKLILELNEINTDFRKQLEKSKILFITLGTAWYFKHLATNTSVGNCHKLPQNEFERKLLSPQLISESLSRTLNFLQKHYPSLHVILTVSPVRHTRDTLVGNNRSKGALLYSIQEIEEAFQNVSYFPSYEVLMDELRDYRFYSEDLVQPSSVAKEIIWERFSDSLMSSHAKQFIKHYSKIKRAMNHSVSSDSDQTIFAKKMLYKISQIEQQFPILGFSEERKHFNSLR